MTQPSAAAPTSAAPNRAARGIRWWPIAAAGVVVITVSLCLITAWGGIWGSHPAYWITLLVSTFASATLAAWAWRSSPGPARSKAYTWAARAALVAITSMAAGALFWLRPIGAEENAIFAMSDGDGVTVDSSPTRIWMRPDDPKATGMVFYPGAKVDPRAYAHILRPLAEAGYTVVIVKFPYNLAVLGINTADDVVGDDDGIDRWVIGGHSLGGAMAASYAGTSDADELSGLLLYAAYPASDLSDDVAFGRLDIVSVYGTNDGLATTDDIDRSRGDLPADASFVPIEGGIHAFFGDYGSQRGDGTATISRDEAQAQIVAASLAQMKRVDLGG